MTYKLSFIGFGDNLELLWAKIWLFLDGECKKIDPRRSVDTPVVSNMGGSYR
jgi:hypothetical protein